MPKLTCFCGYNINLTPVPNKKGFIIVWEPARDAITDQITLLHQEEIDITEFKKMVIIYLMSRNSGVLQAYECENCGRLAIFEAASDSMPTAWYRKENHQPLKDDPLSLEDMAQI